MNNNKMINKAHKLLKALPKKCSCHACLATKKYIKNELGEVPYKKVLKELSLKE